MTDEKKKDSDEITDEQLEGVAGGADDDTEEKKTTIKPSRTVRFKPGKGMPLI